MDILFAIIPKIEPFAPTTGPALLKSHCEAAGLTAIVRDYNIDLYKIGLNVSIVIEIFFMMTTVDL